MFLSSLTDDNMHIDDYAHIVFAVDSPDCLCGGLSFQLICLREDIVYGHCENIRETIFRRCFLSFFSFFEYVFCFF